VVTNARIASSRCSQLSITRRWRPGRSLRTQQLHEDGPDGHLLATVARVVRALDGMPLAIELAAGRLSSMTLDDLEARLERALDLLQPSPASAGGDRPDARGSRLCTGPLARRWHGPDSGEHPSATRPSGPEGPTGRSAKMTL
jgi:hypothetical protein